MARVAAYLRRSSPGEEAKNYSIESQLDDITRWAEREGHTIVRSYSDPGGKSFTLNRPIFQQTLTDARGGHFDIVAVGRYDRFSRNQIQQSVAIYQFGECDVKVISATQPVPEGALGDFMKGSYAFAAELELENIRARTYAGKKARVHSGRLPAAPRPKYGYRYTDDKKERYEPHPETAGVVQRIFAMSAGGATIRKIALTLTKEGVPTPSQQLVMDGYPPVKSASANEWRRSMIGRMLRDKAYVGKLVGHAVKVAFTTRKHPVTGESIPVRRATKRATGDPDSYQYSPDVCPPLVTEEVFAAVAERLVINKEQASRNTKHPEEVLLRSGLASCGHCGRKLALRWGTGNGGKGTRVRVYTCIARRQSPADCPAPKHINIVAANLDSAAWEWFTRQLAHPERMRESYERYRTQSTALWEARQSQIRATRAALEQAREQEESFLAAIGNARTDTMRERFVGLAEEANGRYMAITRELEGLEAKAGGDQQLLRMLQTFEEFTVEFAQNVAAWEVDEMGIPAAHMRRGFIAYDVKATVYAKGHEPRYRFTWMGGVDPESDSSVPNQRWSVFDC